MEKDFLCLVPCSFFQWHGVGGLSPWRIKLESDDGKVMMDHQVEGLRHLLVHASRLIVTILGIVQSYCS